MKRFVWRIILRWMGGGGVVCPFRRKEFWKCIGFVLSAVAYGNKVQKLWSEIPKYFGNKAPTKLQRDVRGNTNLYKACCDHHRHFYIYASYWIILSYTTLFSSWMFLWVLTSIYLLHIYGISLTRFNCFSTFWPCYFVDPLVKVADDFWKVRGFIDGSKIFSREIYSGVENR